MKQLLLKIIFIISIIISCKKEGPPTDQLVGTWSLTNLEFGYSVTTNSDQTALNPLEEGSGGIQLAGVEEETLTYLQTFGESIIVNNNILADKSYLLMLFRTEFSNYAGLSVMSTTEGISNDYYGSAEFTFDGETLIIIEGALVNEEQDSVFISGELTGAFVSIPQNTPTAIPFSFGNDITINETMVLSENGTYTRTRQLTTGVTTAEGTWTADNELVTFSYAYEDTIIMTAYSYSVTNQKLTFWNDEDDACTELNFLPSDLECFEFYEQMFRLDRASLLSVKLSSFLEYEPISTTARIISAGKVQFASDNRTELNPIIRGLKFRNKNLESLNITTIHRRFNN